MRNLFAFSFLLLSFFIGKAQNLVPNPSFEEYSGCPVFQGAVYLAKHWNSFGNSPEYYNSCSPSWEFSTPQNLAGWQTPKSGGAYIGAGFFASHDTLQYAPIREFIGTKLNVPLMIGGKYYISFYASVADSPNVNNAVQNKLGVLFTTQSYAVDSFCQAPCEISLMLPVNRAHVYTNSVIDDMISWIKISGVFFADSAYEYIAIGNFFTNDNVTYVSIPSRPGITKGTYYYIDDVCVSTDSMLCNTTVGIQEPKQNEAVNIYPNPFTNQLSLVVSNAEEVTVHLSDMLGRQVLLATFSASAIISTASLARGVYFYSLENEKGIMKKGKVVRE